MNEHRSLGAPLVVEIEDDTLSVWSIGGHKDSTHLQHKFRVDEFHNWLTEHRADLGPEKFLRTKDVRGGPAFYQQSFFAGLIPELDGATAKTLDPLLRDVITRGITEYKRTEGSAPQKISCSNSPSGFRRARCSPIAVIKNSWDCPIRPTPMRS